MHLPRLAFAACLAASFSFMSPAGAAPLVSPDAQPAAQGMVVPVRGCHADVRRHYVPEYGRTVTHRHRRDCRPVRVDGGGGRDCHRDARRHFVPGYGRVVHRHVGPNCRVRVLRRYDRGGRNCVQIGPIRYCEG
jgi:hypothetical protein